MVFDFNKPYDRRGTNSVKWDECSNPDMLPLWVADMDFPTAPCVQKAIMNRAVHGCYGYTLVPDAYYDAIIHWFATRHDWNIGRDHILYTIGVIPAIAAILKAVCQTGDNVVLLTPVYNCFFNLVRNAGCQAIEVELSHHRRPEGVINYDIDWSSLETALSHEKTTVLLFCNPHNPAGRLWSAEEMTHVASLCHKYGVMMISDEIHNELTAPDVLYTPFGPVAEAFNRQLASNDLGASSLKYAICTSPSKSFNIAGLQNANIICPDADLRRRIDRAINLNETCDVNPFGIEAVIAAYNEGAEWLDELRQHIYDNYDFACDYLHEQFPGIGIAQMQGTYLMWVDASELMASHQPAIKNVAELCQKLMTDANLWLCAGSIYGKAGEGFVRINLACTRQTLAEALKRFAEYFRK